MAHTGAMIALIPSAADAERLAVAWGEPAGELHVTLAYLGKAELLDPEARQHLVTVVAAAVNGMPVVEADAFGLAVFNPTGPEPCLVLNVGGDPIDGVHHLIHDAVPSLPNVGQHAPWVPHVTLAFTGDLARLADLTDRIGPVRFDRVRLAFGGALLDIPLDGENETGEDEDLEGDWSLVEADDDRNSLRRYFTLDPRGLKRWAARKHPWSALFKILRQHLDPERAKRVTSAWYLRVFHRTPNQKVAESDRLVEADQPEPDLGDDQSDDRYAVALAALLLAWPVAAAPLITFLAVAAGPGGGTIVVPQAAVDVLSAALATSMRDLAAITAGTTQAAAITQGVHAPEPVRPDGTRIADFASATAMAIANSLTATAVDTALHGGDADRIRETLTAAGVSPRGAVATRFRSALTAAEHEGRRAVFEAHPPAYLVADERHQKPCAECKDVDGRVYPNLAAALLDYPVVGYLHCAGGAARCRGRLAGVWSDPLRESQPGRVSLGGPGVIASA